MSGRSVYPESRLNLFLDFVGKRIAVLHRNEKNDSLVVVIILTDGYAIRNSLNLSDLIINFRSTDTDARGFKNAVASSVEGDSARFAADNDVISVLPDSGEHSKVCVMVSFARRIVPESQRHRRSRLFADELALNVSYRLSVDIETVYSHTETGSLKFVGINGAYGITRSKAAVNIRTARNGAEMKVALDFLIDVLEAFVRESRACL